jgi:hypothetical protein
MPNLKGNDVGLLLKTYLDVANTRACKLWLSLGILRGEVVPGLTVTNSLHNRTCALQRHFQVCLIGAEALLMLR